MAKEIERVTYSVSETAAALGVSRQSVYNLMHSDNDFPVLRLGGRTLIPVDRLREWVAARGR